MATGKIEKQPDYSEVSTHALYMTPAGGGTARVSGLYVVNAKLKLVEVILNDLTTSASLSVGNTYQVGALDNYKPYADVRIDINRRDGGNAVGSLTIGTGDGYFTVRPLVTIPSGVGLRAHATYFYQ